MYDNVAYFLRLFFFKMLLSAIIILIFSKIHKEILSKFLNLFVHISKNVKLFILLILLILVKLLLLKTKIINPFKN